jgi:formylglycine-generating enzyme required for sulfatase activity
VLDACRDNPIAAAGVRSIGGTRGLTRVEAPKGVFVLFAAGMGQTALDRLGDNDLDPNSVFTRKLVPLMKTPGLTHLALAKRVQQQVDELAATVHHPQQPAYYDQIIGEIELSPAAAATASPAATPPVPAPGSPGPVQASAPGPQPASPPQQVAAVAPPAPVSPPTPVEPAVATFPKPQGGGQYKPNETFKDCEYCPEMVVVPAGQFVMEGGFRGHQFQIGSSFAVGKFEVTFDEWDACIKEKGCLGYVPGDSGWGRGQRPVINVSRDDTKDYIAWLSKKSGKPYRLLSDAEWEYVSRAGSTNLYWTGVSVTKADANFAHHGTPVGARTGTTLVGTYRPNGFGLHDTLGNVWEWVADCWHDYWDKPPSDGSAWTSDGDCSRGVIRGGSWSDHEKYFLSGRRELNGSSLRTNRVGLRVARDLSP